MKSFIAFEAGLIDAWEPDQPFVVLADPAAVPDALALRWTERWGPLCRGWVSQDHSQSSVAAAQALASRLWPLLAQQPDSALWAIGGGTTLDLAKLLRWRMPDVRQAGECWLANQLPAQAAHHALWCSPSTAGTGSEVTPWATLWDVQSQPARKRSWQPPQAQPERALIDPCLTLSCPASVTRDCALDALAHAIDSLCNRRADHTSRGQARQAARRILHDLPALLAAPEDLGLRTRMAHASLLAGLAMARTQTSLAHALSYELTLTEGLPHGHACAVWLPMVLDLAVRHSPRVREDVRAVFDQPAELAADRLSQWLLALGVVPRELRSDAQGQALLQQALASERGANFVAAHP